MSQEVPNPTTQQEEPSPALRTLYRVREPIGRLHLHIKDDGNGKSVAQRRYHDGQLRVMRAHYLDDSGQVYYTIINPGGGYFGGDDYEFKVKMEPGSSMLLTGQSATKVYKTPDDYALQHFDVELAENSVLEYIPDQLIAYHDAKYEQHMRVRMHPTASFLTAEIVTPGWAPDGTFFKYDELRLRTVVEVGGELATVDNQRLKPSDGTLNQDSVLYLEDMTHFATLLALDARINQELVDDLREIMDLHASTYLQKVQHGISLIDGPGLAVRAVGNYTEDLFSLVTLIASELRGRFRGQEPIHLRKY